MTGKRLGYVRVSTADQNPDRQIEAIKADRFFIDKCSGGSIDRPQLEALLDFAREDDVVLVHSMDRLARNLPDLLAIVDRLTKAKVRIEFIKENLVFTGDDSPMSSLLLSVMGAFAQFERSLIRERQKEGIALAKAKGAYRGRAKSLRPTDVEAIKARIQAGEAKAALAREFGISRQTLYEHINQNNEASTQL